MTDDNDSNDWTDDESASGENRDETTTGTQRESSARQGRGGTWSNANLRERLQWVALVVLVLVAVVTLFLFYTNVSRLISIWASRRYAPALQAAFALMVLASALAGIARLSRNLS